MRGLRLLVLVLIATAFAAGGVLRASPAEASAMPACHEMADPAAHHAPVEKDADQKSKSRAMAASCCVGCLPAGQRVAAGAFGQRDATLVAFFVAQQAMDGLDAGPEPRPPRG